MGVGAGLCMYDVVVKKFTFAIASPAEFLVSFCNTSVLRYSYYKGNDCNNRLILYSK